MNTDGKWVRAGGGPAVIAATFLAMFGLTRGKYCDVQVDFGHELYAAWQLCEGRVLGRDLHWIATGPLSPYVNALLFRIFGAELRVLMAFNLLVVVLVTCLVHGLVRALSDQTTATIACVMFLCIFAFGQYVGGANYNYVTPYSHGATHGLALALVSLWLLHLNGAHRSGWLLVLAGLAIGMVFLTKPEIFLATVAAAGAWWFALLRRSEDVRRSLGAAGAVAGAALIPPALALAMLRFQLPLGEAWRVTAMPWLVIATPLARTPFYLAGMGLDDPTGNLGVLARSAGTGAAVVGLGWVAEAAARRARMPTPAVGLCLFSVALLGLGLLVPAGRWFHVARPLPLVVLVGAAAYAVRVFGKSGDAVKPGAAWLGLTLSVFSLALLGKMVLNARIVHYGFVLAMPASILVVVWLWWSVPQHLRARGMDGGVFRGLAAALLAVVAIVHVGITLKVYQAKQCPVGSGGNAFVSDERGRPMNEALRQIEMARAPAKTLTVLPDGVMVNFLARRTTPTPYLAYTPEMIAGYGEDRLLAPLRRAPPDLVLLLSRDTSEYGARTFGKDYGRAIMSWVDENYMQIWRAGGTPLEPGAFGVLLFQRREAAAGLRQKARADERGAAGLTPPAPRTTAPSPPARGAGAPRSPSPPASG